MLCGFTATKPWTKTMEIYRWQNMEMQLIKRWDSATYWCEQTMLLSGWAHRIFDVEKRCSQGCWRFGNDSARDGQIPLLSVSYIKHGVIYIDSWSIGSALRIRCPGIDNTSWNWRPRWGATAQKMVGDLTRAIVKSQNMLFFFHKRNGHPSIGRVNMMVGWPPPMYMFWPWHTWCRVLIYTYD